jgi:hypothetical protein
LINTRGAYARVEVEPLEPPEDKEGCGRAGDQVELNTGIPAENGYQPKQRGYFGEHDQ